MSSGLPSMAVEPVDELSNEEWSVKELNSFLLNEGAYLSGKRRSRWSGKSSAFSGYFGLLYCRLKYFSLLYLLSSVDVENTHTHFSMQNPDAPRTKKGTTSSSVPSSCPTFHASDSQWMSDEPLFPRVSATPCLLVSNAGASRRRQ